MNGVRARGKRAVGRDDLRADAWSTWPGCGFSAAKAPRAFHKPVQHDRAGSHINHDEHLAIFGHLGGDVAMTAPGRFPTRTSPAGTACRAVLAQQSRR